ncbi:MAG: LysR family transcriptional regulator [Mixta calida]|mgnify:CR=1 FL=1|uniref:LysR family transcriptional regulator n=1 Tax=Mixta TaxID=2100764 RepID=UPI000535E70F|nr:MULTISPECIES: LysR family transcriptional regulator [Mixta]AIX74055.1 LysR family transcriptional regulator [Pantoea sp. PSNIH2]MDU3818008.1 LysR family transcriptional regulator [Pantoea sp.]POU43007.1 LysR family transcriptional regulator [Pantoea sp. PSNIH5]POU61261.1 LysR family transcriptional regulator [Pantoea sp. PSNIH4]POY66201.1 LysR family transcriptional regulator [Pantoea sp. PSNIH3]
MKSEMNSIPVFVAAAETVSFAQAAEKLHVTRSAVAKTISRLEERLGVTLFNRTTRSQSLTDEGTLYYEYCRRALSLIKTAEDVLEGGKLQASGKLRVTVPVLLGHLCIAPLLSALAHEHPKLELEISFSDRQVDLTEEGFDLAVRIGTLADSSSLIARKLASYTMVFCASPDYLRQAGEPASPEELQRHAAVAYVHSGRILKWQIKNEEDGISEINPPARIMMDDMQAVKNFAVTGGGIVWLPYWLVREQLASGELKAILKDHASGSWPVYAVWLRNPHLPLKVRLAVDKLVSALPTMMATVEDKA